MNFIKTKLFLTGLISILFLAGFAYADFSSQIPIQGKLLDSNSLPITGSHSIQFKIYDVASGGTPLFSETLSSVQVTNGLFSVVLGEDSNNPLNLAFDNDYYVEISVNSETLSPRQKLLPGPYAITAKNVKGGVVNATNGAFDNRVSVNSYGSELALSYNTDGDQLLSFFNPSNNLESMYIWNPNSSSNLLAVQSPNFAIQKFDPNTGQHINQLYVNEQGNVGIGTTTPEYKLHLVGNIKANGTVFDYVQAGNIILTNTNSASTIAGNLNVGGHTNLGSLEADNVSISGAGSLGIGIQNPGEKLDVAGNVRANGICIGSDCRTSWPTSSATYWNQNGNNIYYSSGNVGIGTTTPTQKLDVNGSIMATNTGYFGSSSSVNRGVSGTSSSNYGVIGQSTSNIGVYGISSSSVGVYGLSTNNYGVYGQSAGTYGIYGRSTHSSYGGVLGYDAAGSYYGILGYQGYSLYGNGAIYASKATLTSTGGNVPHACQVRTNSINFNNNVAVSCSTGEIATGGGGACSENVQLRYTRPNTGSGTPTGWEIYYVSQCNTVTAYAICCQV